MIWLGFDWIGSDSSPFPLVNANRTRTRLYRTQGIRDQDIRQILDRGQTPVQSRNVAAFLRICHTNMALALCQLGDYRQAIRACDCAIDLFSDGEEEEEDGRNGGGAIDNHDDGNGSGIGSDGRSKAYLIRAQARLAPKSCGVAEEEMALSDLEMARRLNPRSTAIRWVVIQFCVAMRKDCNSEGVFFRALTDSLSFSCRIRSFCKHFQLSNKNKQSGTN